ncbi:MAG: HIT domain-containing protein [Bacteroidota bacterium]|nr:HIT domain-containing protein [Bacteroidota bacterium]
MASIFTKIINKELPGYIIDENQDFIAFLDINPLTMGHSLIVPKKEIDHFFNLDDKILEDILIFSKRISKALKKTVECDRIGISVIGLEVPHAHLHLIPINQEGDMNFTNEKIILSKNEFKNLLSRIKSNLD